MSVISLSVLLIGLLSVGSACYISNCPIGGKRSLTQLTSRKCMTCGPGKKGQCFGPSICCGASLGCLVGSPETLICMEENNLSSPCETGGRSCGSEGGRCAAPGICCDSQSCSVDQSCLTEDKSDQENTDENILMRFLHLHTPSRTH